MLVFLLQTISAHQSCACRPEPCLRSQPCCYPHSAPLYRQAAARCRSLHTSPCQPLPMPPHPHQVIGTDAVRLGKSHHHAQGKDPCVLSGGRAAGQRRAFKSDGRRKAGRAVRAGGGHGMLAAALVTAESACRSPSKGEVGQQKQQQQHGGTAKGDITSGSAAGGSC